MKFLLLIFFASLSLHAWEWSNQQVFPEFSRRFPEVSVAPAPSRIPPGVLDMSVRIRYSTFEYSGVILRCYLILEEKSFIHLGSDYRYFYGTGDLTIHNHFNIPDTVLRKKPSKLYFVLLYTIDPVLDQRRKIAEWEYEITAG